MIFFYRGLGFLVPVLFMTPLLIIGSILAFGFDIDILEIQSWWPLHILVMLGGILTFAIGRYVNRNLVEEVVYEMSGPVTSLKPGNTFYFVRMEYWGPIIFLLYVTFVGARIFV